MRPGHGLLAACFALLFLGLGVKPICADKLVLRSGEIIFGSITDERDSLIRYYDRFERPRKIKSGLVDTIQYDSKAVRGLVKVAFRKGQPKDRSGFFRIRQSEELDLDIEYRTDSLSQLDLFFRNNVHIRVLETSHFKVVDAPKSSKDPLRLDLYSGKILATSPQDGALARIVTPWGVGVGRGSFQVGVVAAAGDSSVLVHCSKGLVGAQEGLESPGELVVEEGNSISLKKQEGIFSSQEPKAAEVSKLLEIADNMGHYRFSEVEYPKVGYLPKAITGLGFMVFFYGSAIGILNYVNHI